MLSKSARKGFSLNLPGFILVLLSSRVHSHTVGLSGFIACRKRKLKAKLILQWNIIPESFGRSVIIVLYCQNIDLLTS